MNKNRQVKKRTPKIRKAQAQSTWQAGHRNRLIAVFVIFSSFFLVLMSKLVIFQVWQDEKVNRLTQRQAMRQITLTSARGTIFDTYRKPLAMSVRVPSVYLDPARLEQDAQKIKKLCKLLGVSKSTWKKKTKQKQKRFVWLKRKLNPALKKDIEKINLKGVNILFEWERLYPFREQAAQVLGFVNVDGKGMEGLERSFDDVLSSQNFTLKTKKDAKGRPILIKGSYDKEAKQPANVHLTLDQNLQYFLEVSLGEAVKTYGVESAFGVLMDPHDGAIKAMASFPQVNPNRLDLSLPKARKNRNVLDVFEPGSTFKVFVMTQALEDQVVKTQDVLSCKEGSLKIGIKEIANPVDKDQLTPEGIIKYSNNVCMAKIGIKGGKKMMMSMMRNFGFDQKTGIGFPFESKGLFDPKRTWRDMRLANISFGQGLAVTGMQMARAMSVIANGGYQIQPHIVKSIMQPNGKTSRPHAGFKRKKIFKDTTISHMKQFLKSAIDKDGTGRNAALENYTVAGKTGTAQIFDLNEKKYSHEKVVSSFLGFSPVEAPKLVLYIVFNSPKEPQYGGKLAAPVFKNIMKRALHYLHVPENTPPT